MHKPKKLRFNKRQLERKARRERHQKTTAKLMCKLGGYASSEWEEYCKKVRAKTMKRFKLVEVKDQEEEKPKETPKEQPYSGFVETTKTEESTTVTLS